MAFKKANSRVVAGVFFFAVQGLISRTAVFWEKGIKTKLGKKKRRDEKSAEKHSSVWPLGNPSMST